MSATGMIPPPRKFFTECAVSLFSAGWMMFSPDQLHSGKELPPDSEFADECHIYLICRRPSFSIEPESFTFNAEFFQGNILVKSRGQIKKVPFKLPYGEPEGAVTFKVDNYPHKNICAYDKDGKTCDVIWPADFILIAAIEDMDLRSHEVLYVGQSYGDGDRSAIDRLKSHSTLQRILAEVNAKTPDEEVRIFIFQYKDYQLIYTMDGISSDIEIKDDRDLEHLRSIFDRPLTKKEQIGLIEAGLIRYFQPEYNLIYKDSFPQEEQRVLKNCYGLDIAGLIVEIDTEDYLLPIYSSVVPKGVHHIAKFDLCNIQQRRSFFSIVDQDGRYALINNSGPTY